MKLPFSALATTESNDPESRWDGSHAQEGSPLIDHLELDLKHIREELRSTTLEMESSNEELKSSNEEIMSMNEELQSANEELESSKEELQSLNEELSTVNVQLHDKVSELDKSNSDMINFIASSEIATVFLDDKLLIQRFTPSTVQLLSLLRRTSEDLCEILRLVLPMARCFKIALRYSQLEFRSNQRSQRKITAVSSTNSCVSKFRQTDRGRRHHLRRFDPEETFR